MQLRQSKTFLHELISVALVGAYTSGAIFIFLESQMNFTITGITFIYAFTFSLEKESQKWGGGITLLYEEERNALNGLFFLISS